jgi:hypothetical protein
MSEISLLPIFLIGSQDNVLNAHDLAEEFSHLPLRLMEKMNIHGRVEHVELLVDEERL